MPERLATHFEPVLQRLPGGRAVGRCPNRLGRTGQVLWRLPGTLVILAALARLAVAQTLVGDRFEGPDVSLRDAGGDARYKIEPHARVAQGPIPGSGASG